MSPNASSDTRRAIYLVLLLSIVLHSLLLVVATTASTSWLWVNVPVHSVIEVAGACSAFFVAILLFHLDRNHKGSTYNLPIAAAMVTMGVFDGAHALAQPGQVFVWLHSIGTLISGLFFSVLLLPRSTLNSLSWAFVPFALVLSIAISSLSFVFEQYIPAMIDLGQFTASALWLNLLGGALLFAVAFKLYLSFRRYNNSDDLIFVLLCAILGLADLLFWQSALWDMTWWGWHFLRIFAYAMALWFCFQSILQILRVDKEKTAMLTQQIDEQAEKLFEVNRQLEFLDSQQVALLGSLHDPVIVIDSNSRVVLFTPAAERTFGFKQAEVVGSPIELLMTKEIAMKHHEYVDAFTDNGTSRVVGINRELIARRKDGSEFPIELAVNSFNTKDALFFIGVLRDISDRKANERKMQNALKLAESSSKAKSEFLANMSHEIRTPLNAIYGTIQILQRENHSAAITELLSRTKYSCQSLQVIINDILDYSKIEQNKLELEYKEINLDRVAGSIIEDFKLTHENRNVGIEYLFCCSDKNWKGDPVRIGQILRNLISNAIKFTKRGLVKLQISYDNDSSRVIFEVTDTGIGMDEVTLKRVFNRFEQADASTTRQYGGTGLGMSISFSLVQLMQGELSAESQLKKGTKIKVSLPLTPVVSVSHATALNKNSVKKLDLADKKILVAEDNKVNQMVIKALLKKTKATVKIVENGLLACSEISRFAPDIVLMDIQMPIMDGVEACKKILDDYPTLPIVAVTANVMQNDIEKYQQVGFSAHLGKPIEFEQLENVLRAKLV